MRDRRQKEGKIGRSAVNLCRQKVKPGVENVELELIRQVRLQNNLGSYPQRGG